MTVATVTSLATRVKPPADLPAPVRAIWAELVDSLPASRFHASDRPLLALYCRALHQASLAYGSLEKHGAIDSAAAMNPALKVADLAAKQCATLATKLRLCPQARLDRKVAGPAARGDSAGHKPWETEA